MKKALVCGAGGFIASHLVKRLKKDGCWVRGVDIKRPEYSQSPADEFLLLDLRGEQNCQSAVSLPDGGKFDEVYQLAADMGGMGFISSAECEIMRNSALININMTHVGANLGVKRYFFSSSACVYRDMKADEAPLTEADAYPALPDNEYGWEKLYAERMAMAYGRRTGMVVRLARFQNTYGPEGTWRGGREKAPAALCRKIALAPDGGTIEVWGDGKAMRAYTYIDDLVDGIVRLMHSDLENGVNIGRPEYVSVDQLIATIAAAAGKKIHLNHIPGPVGVQARNFTNDRIRSTGWESKFSLRDGIARTYPWIRDQIEKTKLAGK
ncbi:MAG: NAD-dependent epimerase/dehydratase family protein [Candidatus Aminicenantales bacterium]|jgi:nucleoside-diphosphate-sugar epimerase